MKQDTPEARINDKVRTLERQIESLHFGLERTQNAASGVKPILFLLALVVVAFGGFVFQTSESATALAEEIDATESMSHHDPALESAQFAAHTAATAQKNSDEALQTVVQIRDELRRNDLQLKELTAALATFRRESSTRDATIRRVEQRLGSTGTTSQEARNNARRAVTATHALDASTQSVLRRMWAVEQMLTKLEERLDGDAIPNESVVPHSTHLDGSEQDL